MARARRLEAISSEARKKGHHKEGVYSASLGARRICLVRIKNKSPPFTTSFKHHMVTNFAFVAHRDINVKTSRSEPRGERQDVPVVALQTERSAQTSGQGDGLRLCDPGRSLDHQDMRPAR